MLSRPQHYTSDYDILYYLDHIWLPNLLSNGLTQPPWLCCVSFVNPHDIASFPSYYGFTGSSSPCSPNTRSSYSSSTCAFIQPTGAPQLPLRPARDRGVRREEQPGQPGLLTRAERLQPLQPR